MREFTVAFAMRFLPTCLLLPLMEMLILYTMCLYVTEEDNCLLTHGNTNSTELWNGYRGSYRGALVVAQNLTTWCVCSRKDQPCQNSTKLSIFWVKKVSDLIRVRISSFFKSETSIFDSFYIKMNLIIGNLKWDYTFFFSALSLSENFVIFM